MSEDFIERVEKSWERHTGTQWTPEKTLDNLVLYSKTRRIEALEQIDAAMKDADTSNLREYSKLARIQREAELRHQLLIKNGR